MQLTNYSLFSDFDMLLDKIVFDSDLRQCRRDFLVNGVQLLIYNFFFLRELLI